MNKNVALFIATSGGIGRYLGGGTIMSFLITPCLYLPLMVNSMLLAVSILLAYFTIPTVCAYYKKDDPRQIVIDEAIGALLLVSSLQYYFLDVSIYEVLLGMILFRVFDISKIGGIHYFEMIPGATGVIADDIVAAFYAYFSMYLFFL